MEIFTKSAAQTQKLGEKIGRDLILGKLKPKIICLYGQLGSGKTTFIQGLAHGLGIKKRILSPTFVMMREYQVQSAKYIAHRFYHIDLYRIENEKEADMLGLYEVWSDPQNIIAIEWAEKIKNISPKKRMDIHFEYMGKEKRKIILQNEMKILLS